MKIEIDTDKIKSLVKIHPARVTGFLTCNLIQFIVYGTKHDFYISLVPYAIYLYVLTITYCNVD